jgi:GNAT superfamily N-acetyltransferase
MLIETRRPGGRAEGAVARLEAFFAAELGCAPGELARPGVRLFASPSRETPGWCGFRLPLLAVAHSDAALVSVEPALLPEAGAILHGNGASDGLSLEAIGALRRLARERYPRSQSLCGRALYCEAGRFRPHESAPVERLDAEDPKCETLREHFDGPVFVARAQGGEVASWAAIKLKGEDVWEIAVTTEARYQGRGLGTLVVSAATRHILEQGRVPLYVHDETNLPSGKVARRLGYEQFAREAYCSVSETNREGMW